MGGVDSSQGSAAALAPAKRLAQKYPGTVVCVSGEVDYVVSARGDACQVSAVPHGVEILTKVTATGCPLNSVMAAFIASSPADITRHEACALAFTYYGRCAELAAEGATGPGSFRVAFLDILYSLTEAQCGSVKTKLDAEL